MNTAIRTHATTGEVDVEFQDVIGRRVLQVSRVEDLSPNLRRIVLTGDDLASGFPFIRFAPSDHVKVFFPQPDTGDLVVPQITDDGWVFPDGAADPLFRDYTVRHYDADANELWLDFVLHDHGVAGRWAITAAPGDELGVLGPRGLVLFPIDYGHYVIAVDETAIPAATRFIAEAPEGARVTAFLTVEDENEIHELPGAERATVTWVPRATAPVGEGHESALETALRGLEIDDIDEVFAFAAGEATMLKPIRRYFRRELGLPKHRVDVDGYWKKGVENLDHHADVLGDED